MPSQARTRNENRGEYPWNWRRISYRAKRLHGFRCERCHHPHVPRRPERIIYDLWNHDWEVTASVVWARAPRTTLAFAWPWRRVRQNTKCDGFCTHAGDSKHRILTTHHLDGDKSNWRLWNLAALCQVCHLQVQAKICWDQTYLGEHSIWLIWHIERYRRWCERTGRVPIH